MKIKRTIFAAIAIILGILLSLQIRSFQRVDLLVQRSEPGDIFAEMRVLQIANTQLRAHLKEEEKALSEIKSTIADRALEEEMNRLRLLSGEEEIFGEGMEITLNRSIKEFWITDLIAQLVGSGAEAIALNNIRLIAETAGFRDLGTGLLMRKHFFNPPLRLSVIGSRKELKQSVAQSGGILDRIENAYPGLKIAVTEKEKIIIPAVPD
jgi:uncharacterized protein YlxW (UPF0749 family)